MTHHTHPSQVIRYCPKCGSRAFKSHDNGRSFNCEGCRFNFYLNNSAAVACLIFNEEGQLLLTRRAVEPAKGMLDLPGGFVEPMETAESAVIREIREELGITVTDIAYLGSFPNEYIFSGFSVFTIDLAFVCKVDDLSAIWPADDVSSVEYKFPPAINKEELCSRSMAQIIDLYIQKFSL